MRVFVLNGSPKGELSVTLQYVHFIARKYPEHEIKIVHVSPRIKALEKKEDQFKAVLAEVEKADIVLWAFPVYVCLVPSQYKRFIELLFERKADGVFHDKYCAIITTSVHFYDHTALNYAHAVCEDMGMRCLGGYSADMYDLLKPGEREKILQFMDHVFHAVGQKAPVAKRFAPLPTGDYSYTAGSVRETISSAGKKILIVTDAGPGDGNLSQMTHRFRQSFPEPPDVVNLNEIDIKGGCTGCLECGYDNTCVYEGKDGFVDFYRKRVLAADILIVAGTIRDRYLSSTWKCYFDRVFFNNHVPTLIGKQIGFIISGPLLHQPNLRQILESYTEWQKANLVDIVTDESADAGFIDLQLQNMAERSVQFALEKYVRPESFLGIAGIKLFRDEIWGRLRFVFHADHLFYGRNGLYDFPQKEYKVRGRNLVMNLLTAIPAFRKEFRKRIRQEMVKPLQNVVGQK